MKEGKYMLCVGLHGSSIVMLLVLLWLTISPPFIQEGLKEKQKWEKLFSQQGGECMDCPSSNDENIEDNSPVLPEYLSEQIYDIDSYSTLKEMVTGASADLYIAFHPQLHSPPPEA